LGASFFAKSITTAAAMSFASFDDIIFFKVDIPLPSQLTLCFVLTLVGFVTSKLTTLDAT
jgi:uncharacterized membrane protein YccC